MPRTDPNHHLRRTAGRTVLSALLLLLAAPLVLAQAEKQPIPYSAYEQWRSIQSPALSPDGKWLAYTLARGQADPELVVRSLDGDQEFHYARGRDPRITRDSRFVIFVIGSPPAPPGEGPATAAAPAGGRPGGGRGRGSRGAGPGGGPAGAPGGTSQAGPGPSGAPAAGGASRSAPEPPALGIMELPGGAVERIERVRSHAIPEDGPALLAALRSPPTRPAGDGVNPAPPAGAAPGGRVPPEEGGDGDDQETGEPPEPGAPSTTAPGFGGGPARRTPGTDLVIRDLAAGSEAVIPEVSAYAWNRDGSRIAWIVTSASTEKDGVFVREGVTGETRTLLSGTGTYQALRWDESGRRLAFLAETGERKGHWSLYCSTGGREARVVAAGGRPGIPDGCRPSEFGSLSFSRDGRRLFFGVAAPPVPPKPPTGGVVNVDIWHWRDPLLQTMQRVRAEAERRGTRLAVAHLDEGRCVTLGAPDLPTVQPGDGEVLIGSSDLPYRPEISWDTAYRDYCLVRAADGRRETVVKRSRNPVRLSPSGRYAYYFSDEKAAWIVRRVRDGRQSELALPGVPLADELDDHPAPPPSYGAAGWTKNDDRVLIYDRFDIWAFDPDGGAPRCVTRGAGRSEQIEFRLVSLDPDERFVPDDRPLLLRARSTETMATGFYRASLKGEAPPERLVMDDRQFGPPLKARKADRVVFTVQTFHEFPDLWTTDDDFRTRRKLTDANPQQTQYRWGRSELMPFRSEDGQPLQAVVIRPEPFDPNRRYPVLVHIYERLSQQLHRYYPPAAGTSPNFTRYVSHGYIVLQPDIVYRTGYPGESALKCVVPAVQELIRRGWADPERIGIAGHSWGGYQVSYLITRTHLFRAAEAGAPVSNMVSAYGGIRWSTGMSRAFQYERGQSRIGGPPWERALQFLENSPVFWVDKVRTPYLAQSNDQDGAVPWYQGIEFFSALRRLGKEAYLFNYNGEDHGLRSRAARMHWTVHLDEFFDHHLKGAPCPGWMEKGVLYTERGMREIASLFQGEKAATPAAGGEQ